MKDGNVPIITPTGLDAETTILKKYHNVSIIICLTRSRKRRKTDGCPTAGISNLLNLFSEHAGTSSVRRFQVLDYGHQRVNVLKTQNWIIVTQFKAARVIVEGPSSPGIYKNVICKGNHQMTPQPLEKLQLTSSG